MALLSKTAIFIDRKEVPSFKRLWLAQQIDAHHILEVVFRMEMFEKLSTELGEKSKEFLGKTIAIQTGSISDRSEQDMLEFKGLITEIKIVKGANTASGDEIIVIAKSPTVLADDGPHYDSFNEMTLGAIVSQVLNTYALDNIIDARYAETIDYCVQHNESSFNFVSRLAAQYGEWFYYNGEKIIFGKPEIAETELKYNVDLIEFNLSLRPQSQNYNYFTNDYLKNTVEEDHTQSNPTGESAFGGFSYTRSGEIFNNQTNIWNNNNNSPVAKNQLKSKVKAQHDAIAINQLNLTGSSSNTQVKLGNIIKIEGEKFRVINIVHSTNRNGTYQNKFEAISGSFDAYPYTNINAFPRSESQIAIVQENHDPESLGRIKVKFPWQKRGGQMTPWTRMATLHAGAEKGFYYIPEIGEEVIVGFEGGNAETPYISSCLYHSDAKPPAAGSNPNNDIKIIQTRSGCSLTFNDEEGSITLKDKKGSSIVLDGSGNISISATKGVSVSGPKVSVNGSDEISQNGALINVSGTNVNIQTTENVNVAATQEVSLTGTTKVNVNSDTEVMINGLAKTTLSSSGTTSVAGTIIKLN